MESRALCLGGSGMSNSIDRANGSGQSESLDRERRSRATSVAQAEADVAMLRTFIRQAMAELKWTPEALAAEMGYTDASYPGKVLNGEKPLSAAFLVALPDDVEKRFTKKWANHHRFVCAEPLNGAEAAEAIVGAVLGILSPRAMPERADAMLKIDGAPMRARKRA
jgi:hypothetical protein